MRQSISYFLYSQLLLERSEPSRDKVVQLQLRAQLRLQATPGLGRQLPPDATLIGPHALPRDLTGSSREIVTFVVAASGFSHGLTLGARP